MSEILTTPLPAPAAWRGDELTDTDAWQYTLSRADVAVLDEALAYVSARGLTFPDFGQDDFPLAGLAPLLADVAERLENGLGFMLLRGLPVERYSEQELRTVYYGLGLHLGKPVPQNPNGDLLGRVRNVGDLRDKQTRVYETNAYLPYHTDPSDVVGLLCVRPARQGGLSSLVSVASVYNRMLETFPEYLGLFYRHVYYAHLGEDLPTRTPLFSYYAGKFTCRYLRQYIELGHEVMGVPLSPVEVAALDRFDAIAAEPGMRLDMMMEPGDIQFANNYMILHSRTAFEDHEDV